jgi:hypothetical protein
MRPPYVAALPVGASAAVFLLQNKFNSVSAQADEQLARCRQLQQLRPLPDQETASFAMLMMLHGAGWPNHELWEQWQQQHEPGAVTMMVHLKVRLHAAPVMFLCS